MKVFSKLKYIGARTIWRVTKPITTGARILLIVDNNILLVKHTYQEEWYLPGGGVKRGETFEEGIRRELKEELGAELCDMKFFGVYNNFYECKNDTIVIFISENFTLSGKTDKEIETFDFFPLDNLPDEISPGTRRRIAEYINKQFNNFGTW